jgi:hypothetical protein
MGKIDQIIERSLKLHLILFFCLNFISFQFHILVIDFYCNLFR